MLPAANKIASYTEGDDTLGGKIDSSSFTLL